MRTVKRKPTGRLIPCPGEAHGNAFIDNCELCAPRWAVIEELEPLPLDELRKNGRPFLALDLTDEQYLEVLRDRAAGHVVTTRDRRGEDVLRYLSEGSASA